MYFRFEILFSEERNLETKQIAQLLFTKEKERNAFLENVTLIRPFLKSLPSKTILELKQFKAFAKISNANNFFFKEKKNKTDFKELFLIFMFLCQLFIVDTQF